MWSAYLLPAALVALGATQAAAAPLAFDLTSGGLSVRAGGRSLVTSSRLVAVEPPWVQHRFYIRQAKVERVKSGAGAEARVALSSDDPKYPFKLKEYSAAATPEGVRVVVEGGIAEALPTVMEYTALVLPGNLLAGAGYQAILDDGTTSEGHAPLLPRAGIAVLPAFRSATLRTWAGTLRIAVEEGPSLVLTDRRASRFDDQRCFWVGAQGVPVTPERPFRHVMTLSFEPGAPAALPALLPAGGPAAPPTPVTDLKSAVGREMPLLPPAQERVDREGAYVPARGDALWVAPGRGDDHRRLERAARRVVLDRLALPLRPTSERRRPERGVTVEVAGPGVDLPEGARLPEQAEGYWLRVDEQGARIVGRDVRGAFYGLQTLRFLAREGRIPATEIRDWPDFRLRGLHLLADDASLQFHGRLIEDLLVPLKMNHIVFEVEYAGWDATRPLHQPWGMTKADMRALVELARDNFIEITPLVQTLGHCDWLFANGQNADWAEDTETKYAYDASNPAVYAMLEKLLAEVVDVFRPRYLHIGHDEVDMRGRYPARPANVARGAHQLVLDDILWFHRWAQRRGLRLMMWHDMLTTKAEGNVAHGGPPLNMAAIRPRVPRDIVIVDWQYSALESYPEVPMLRNEGFEVIGATWFHPGNIEKMAAYGRDKGMLGMIDTTWTGYHGNRTALQQHFAQIAAYVRSGDRFWNAGAAERPTYDDGDVLAALVPSEEREGFARAARGRLLDLSPWANVSLAAGADPFGLGDAMGLGALPEGEQRYGRCLFRAARRDGGPAGIGVRSASAPALPEAVEGIAVGGKAMGLLLLHTTPLFAPAGTTIGQYVVGYAGGAEEVIPVQYGRDIACPTEDANYYLSVPGFTWEHQGRSLRLWAMEWRNPHPEREIVSLSLRSAGADTAPVLLAVSVVE